MDGKDQFVSPVPLAPESPERTSRHVEYVLAGENVRFLSGIRFALLAFSATVHTALFGAFRALVASPVSFGGLADHALWALPAIGVCTSAAVMLIDARNRSLYLACLKRGKRIESELGLGSNGIFHLPGAARERRRYFSHTWALRAIHLGLFAVWLILWYHRQAFTVSESWV